MKNASYKTAISRHSLSAPASWLYQHGLIKGRVLDFGSGRGFDADYFGAAKYDLNWHPIEPEGKFDTIYCVYVLNVIPETEAQEVLDKIRNLLTPSGNAYIAVRRGKLPEGHTKAGTLQRTVSLALPVLHKESGKFVIYRFEKSVPTLYTTTEKQHKIKK